MYYHSNRNPNYDRKNTMVVWEDFPYNVFLLLLGIQLSGEEAPSIAVRKHLALHKAPSSITSFSALELGLHL